MTARAAAPAQARPWGSHLPPLPRARPPSFPSARVGTAAPTRTGSHWSWVTACSRASAAWACAASLALWWGFGEGAAGSGSCRWTTRTVMPTRASLPATSTRATLAARMGRRARTVGDALATSVRRAPVAAVATAAAAAALSLRRRVQRRERARSVCTPPGSGGRRGRCQGRRGCRRARPQRKALRPQPGWRAAPSAGASPACTAAAVAVASAVARRAAPSWRERRAQSATPPGARATSS